MRSCPGCPHQTPLVSLALAARLGRALRPNQKHDATGRAVDWLTRAIPGVSVTLGKVGQEYRPEERVAIALEVGRLRQSPCPFHTAEGCVLGGFTDEWGWTREDRAGSWTWLPAALLRALNRPLLRDLVGRRLVPDAKVALVNARDEFPMVQSQHHGAYVPLAHERERGVKRESVSEAVQPGPD